MNTIPESHELKVSLDKPMISSLSFRAINIQYGATDNLEISFRRTVRVADNSTAYDLPPDCGPFPIYSVDEYKTQLPASMAAKGGVFVPIYGMLNRDSKQLHSFQG